MDLARPAHLVDMHSNRRVYRIHLATALDAVGCPPDKIKRMLRWVSDESLATYVRPGKRMYDEWLRRAPLARIDAKQTCNLPNAIMHYESDSDMD